MITHLLRMFLGHSLRPFTFRSGFSPSHPLDSDGLGLYLHVPFCRKLCDFCPYDKRLLDANLLNQYMDAVAGEIRMVSSRFDHRRRVESVYFGGGTPALAVDHLPRIVDALRGHFDFDGRMAIELHPDDLEPDTIQTLKSVGFDMVSIGVQSFQQDVLKEVGRRESDMRRRIGAAVEAGFSTVDVDLIFCLPGQTAASLAADFTAAVAAGATQVSTYPFIRFSYANTRYRSRSQREKREMLATLTETAESLGFERSSVWSFTRPGTLRYSSVTRSAYVGFGVSAASLYADAFTINTFAVDAYIESIARNAAPVALTLAFRPRIRELYWLFWSAYSLRIRPGAFRAMFGTDLLATFGPALKWALTLGIIAPDGTDYVLTERGAYWFHVVEQLYTHQYIDKTWRICGTTPWPERVSLY